MQDFSGRAVIIAGGTFPEHEIPLGYLKNAPNIICCDGGAEKLIKAGFIPEAIVGDLDSLGKETAQRFSDRLFPDIDQATNDLTKAVMWCKSRDYVEIIILGATGKREDHTIGNISLLTEYSLFMNVIMVTDTGIFIPFNESFKADTFAGQQISIFSNNPETTLSSSGLKYILLNTKIKNWWVATLNEATGDQLELDFNGGPVIVFFKFRD